MPLAALAQNKIVDAPLRGVPLVMPPVFYVALVTTEGVTNAMAGVEIVGGAYARVPVPNSLATWSGTQGAGSTGVSTGISAESANNQAIVFPVPTENWGTIQGYELWDAAVNGFRWLYDSLSIPKTVSVGDPAPEFPAGAFVISFV